MTVIYVFLHGHGGGRKALICYGYKKSMYRQHQNKNDTPKGVRLSEKLHYSTL